MAIMTDERVARAGMYVGSQAQHPGEKVHTAARVHAESRSHTPNQPAGSHAVSRCTRVCMADAMTCTLHGCAHSAATQVVVVASACAL